MTRPTSDPTWATNTDYPAGAEPWSGQPLRSAPSSGKRQNGWTPAADDAAEEDNYIVGAHGDWITWFRQNLDRDRYMDGSDGAGAPDFLGTAVSGMTWMSGPNYYVMNRDCYFTTFACNGWVKTNGYAIYALTSISVGSSGIVDGSGGAASTTSGGNFSANAGPHIIPGPSGTATTATDTARLFLCGLGSAGGSGGDGTGGNTGTPAATVSVESVTYKFFPYRTGQIPMNNIGTNTQVNDYLRGGACGGSGGGDGTSAGGGGGQGGALVVCISPAIALANGSSMVSEGGAGGSPSGGNTGGGGGGGGGAFLFVAETFTDSGASYSVGGGAAGTHHGTGSADGTAGTAGVSTPFVVTLP